MSNFPFSRGTYFQFTALLLITFSVNYLNAQSIVPINIFQGLNSPRDIAVDTSGNVYIVDSTNNCVFKFNPEGIQQQVFTTISPPLNNPYGVAVDASGNVYVTDRFNKRIVKFNSTGAQQLVFKIPFPLQGVGGIALNTFSPDTNLYVAYPGYTRIAKVNSTGGHDVLNITLPLSNPNNVAIDNRGNLYVVDTGNNRIAKFDPTGAQLQIFTATSPPLDQPTGVAVDIDSNVYVVDTFLNRIVKFNSDGIQQTFTNPLPLLNRPWGIAVDVNRNIYVTDTNNRGLRIDQTGILRQVFAPIFPPLSGPIGIAVDSTPSGVNVYVAEKQNKRVIRLNSSGVLQEIIVDDIDPNGIALDPSSNGSKLYVTDYDFRQIVKLNSTGTQQKILAGAISFLAGPREIAINNVGNLYIVDADNQRVAKLDLRLPPPERMVQIFNNTSPPLSSLRGVAVDTSGNVYVADGTNNRMVKFNSSGDLQSFPFKLPFLDGPRSIIVNSTTGDIFIGAGGGVIQINASGVVQRMFSTGPLFVGPLAIALDNFGRLYAADFTNNRILVFNTTGPPLSSPTISPAGPTSFPGSSTTPPGPTSSPTKRNGSFRKVGSVETIVASIFLVFCVYI